MGQAKLTDISGIGPHTAQVLVDNGIDTVDALASLPAEKLASMPGFGAARAAAVGQAIARLKQPSPGVEETTTKSKKKEKKRSKKKGSQSKGGKKDKKRGKDKKSKKKDRGDKKKKKQGKKGKGKKRK